MNLTGFRTIIIGLLTTIGLPALTYLAGIDWTALGVSPVVASIITSVIFVIMRLFTSTPVFKPTVVPALVAMSDQALHAAGVAKVLVTDPALANATPGVVVAQVTNPSAAQGIGRRVSC